MIFYEDFCAGISLIIQESDPFSHFLKHQYPKIINTYIFYCAEH
jgi:hypothetical protein